MLNHRDESESNAMPVTQPISQFDFETPEVAAAEFQIDNPNIHITGMNGALNRFPEVQAQPIELLSTGGFIPTWKPYWPKLKSFGLTFPAGIDFLPVASEETDETKLKEIQGPKPSECR